MNNKKAKRIKKAAKVLAAYNNKDYLVMYKELKTLVKKGYINI